MCVAILQKAGNNYIPKDDFMGYGRSNPDGFGMLYVEEGKLKQFKNMNLEKFREGYEFISDKLGKETPILVHFRLGTHGNKNLDNCHPFMVNEDLGFIHNGIISIEGKGVDDNFSDTYNFNQLVLKDCGHELIHDKTTQDFVNDWIGYSNKLLFLSSKKETYIYNEQAGDWDDDKQIWYSFKKYKPYTYDRSSVLTTYTYNKAARSSCKKCGQWLLQSEMVAVVNKYGYANHICDKCLTAATTILDMGHVILPFSSRR